MKNGKVIEPCQYCETADFEKNINRKGETPTRADQVEQKDIGQCQVLTGMTSFARVGSLSLLNLSAKLPYNACS